MTKIMQTHLFLNKIMEVENFVENTIFGGDSYIDYSTHF